MSMVAIAQITQSLPQTPQRISYGIKPRPTPPRSAFIIGILQSFHHLQFHLDGVKLFLFAGDGVRGVRYRGGGGVDAVVGGMDAG